MNNLKIEIPLSDVERKSAEENHYLVIAFMERNQLDMDEYYDMLIFRYLNAVRRYHQELEKSVDIVTTINGVLSTALRDLLKKQAKRERYECDASLDAQVYGGFTLLDLISNGEKDVCEECIDRQEEARILSILPVKLRNVLRMRADGYSSREISRKEGIPRRQMKSYLSEIQEIAALWL